MLTQTIETEAAAVTEWDTPTKHVPGYTINRTLGKGGMAVVYLATQLESGTEVALKLLEHQTITDEFGEDEVANRFLNEAAAIASLEHDHIVKFHDAGVTDEAMYIAMEYVPGGDLRARVGEPMPTANVIELLGQIALALGAAHRAGIVHRDVKPGNILFRADHTPLLSDFGIAKNLNEDAMLTQTGTVVGSPAYISPEQAEGKLVDARTDLYGLGVIMYEMLTGRLPYNGESAIMVIMQHLQAPVPRLGGELAHLQPILDRLMAKRQEDRFASADELAQTLADFSRTGNAAGPGAMAPLPLSSMPLAHGVLEAFHRGIVEDLETDRLVLPSVPDVVVKIRAELERNEASADSIAALLALDPALSAQTLRVANSALYGGRASISNLNHAVVRLGLGTVQKLVMMLVVSQLYKSDLGPMLLKHLKSLWDLSLTVAALSSAIARHVKLDRNAALLAGLIHRIGVIPVLTWAEPIPSIMGDERTLSAVVEALQGELGYTILDRWQYPPELIAVPAGQHDVDRQVESADLTDVVQVARHLAHLESDCALGARDWTTLPAAQRLGLDETDEEALVEMGAEIRSELVGALG